MGKSYAQNRLSAYAHEAKAAIVGEVMRLPTILLVSASLLATSALGCGGSKKSTGGGSADPVVEPTTDAQASETPEQKFARQKSDAVDKMCQRLIDCSLSDAEENMPPEELAELNKNREGITAKAVAGCNDEYGAAGMSPRQVIALRECLGQPTECPDFNACLSSAMAPAAAAAEQ